MADLPKGKWCECGLPHETGGPCWECRHDQDAASEALEEFTRKGGKTMDQVKNELGLGEASEDG